ncbi:hypothetical protein F5Y14DRAFT_242201 [Nemania sp. NC0429]|nr:hypothetical protein F5Y14DRAFT_242201 [Nemania sp. NC0429]
MANRALYFFLSATWDLPASPSGPIQLGNVITSLEAPERPLYRNPKIESEIFSTLQTQVKFATEKLHAGRFGIFGRFLASVLGLGIDATASWESSNTCRLSFDVLETTQFYPEQSYLQACVAAEPVRLYLTKSRYRKPLYIVTGLKTARGTKAETLQTRAASGAVSPEVDATVWGSLPVGGGVEVGGESGNRKTVAWEAEASFVFAFRVQKITVKKRTGLVRGEDYQRRALLSAAIEKRFDIFEEDMDGQVQGFSKEELLEDDETVIYAVPTVAAGPNRNVA